MNSPFNLSENDFAQSFWIKVDIISDEYLMRYKSNFKKDLYKKLIKKKKFDYVNKIIIGDWRLGPIPKNNKVRQNLFKF